MVEAKSAPMEWGEKWWEGGNVVVRMRAWWGCGTWKGRQNLLNVFCNGKFTVPRSLSWEVNIYKVKDNSASKFSSIIMVTASLNFPKQSWHFLAWSSFMLPAQHWTFSHTWGTVSNLADDIWSGWSLFTRWRLRHGIHMWHFFFNN